LITHLAERNSWEAWEAEGRQSMAERAQAKAEHLIATHEVPPLDVSQDKELDALLTDAGG
jgi:trimethylamine---corrinoid protein Co-methyltransferase